MRGVVISIDPVALSMGPVAIRWFGIAVVAAIAIGFTLTLRESQRRGLDLDVVLNVGLWALICGIIGARLLHAAAHLSYYLANPAGIPALNEGGLSLDGALLGGLLVVALVAWRTRFSLLPLLDAATPAVALAMAVGWIGCLINGDAPGKPAQLPWSITYLHPESLAPELGVAVHPYPLYEVIWSLAGFLALWRLRGRLPSPGALFLVFVVLYSLGRFGLGLLRQDAAAFLGLQLAQVVALGAIGAALIGVIYTLRQGTHSLGQSQSQAN